VRQRGQLFELIDGQIQPLQLLGVKPGQLFTGLGVGRVLLQLLDVFGGQSVGIDLRRFSRNHGFAQAEAALAGRDFEDGCSRGIPAFG
jgi:hypothetical protein